MSIPSFLWPQTYFIQVIFEKYFIEVHTPMSNFRMSLTISPAIACLDFLSLMLVSSLHNLLCCSFSLDVIPLFLFELFLICSFLSFRNEPRLRGRQSRGGSCSFSSSTYYAFIAYIVCGTQWYLVGINDI